MGRPWNSQGHTVIGYVPRYVWKFMPDTTNHGRCWNWYQFGWIPSMVLGVHIISPIYTAWIPRKAQWDSGQTFWRHKSDGPEEARTAVRGRVMERHQNCPPKQADQDQVQAVKFSVNQPSRCHGNIQANQISQAICPCSRSDRMYYQHDRNGFWPVFSSRRFNDSE